MRSYSNMSTVKQIRVTPTIDTAAYTAGDQVGGVQTLTAATNDAPDRAVKLSSMLVIDKDAEGAALRVYFFKSLPAVTSANNEPLAITDALFAATCIGFVDIGSSDFVADAGFKIASLEDIGLDLISEGENTLGKRDNIVYAVAVAVGTPTYSSASDLTFVYNLEA